MNKTQLKILFISSRADIGGGPKHLLDLLSSNAFKSHLKYAAIPLGHELSDKITQNVLETIEIPHRKFSLLKLLKLKIFCQKNGIQLIHSHGRGAGIYSRLLSLFGIPVVHTFHGIHHEKTIIGEIKLFIDKFLKTLTDHYICVSNDEKKHAISNGVCSSAYVIHNGVHYPKENPYQTKESFKAILLARLSHQKGIDVLINNIRESNLNDVQFEIAGSGEEEVTLKKQSKDISNISFVGKTLNPQKFLLEGDVFISSSRWEGFPLSVLEAMACGLPCLLPDVTGHALFKENKSALFYDLNKPSDFKEKLYTLRNNLDQREYYSIKGHQLISEKLNVEEMASKTISVYKSLV